MNKTYKSAFATGVGGRRYEFQVYPWGIEFQELPGLYIFAKPSSSGGWTALYVGQTHNLEERVGVCIGTHHVFLDALNAGFTHIAVCPFQGRESDRKAASAFSYCGCVLMSSATVSTTHHLLIDPLSDGLGAVLTDGGAAFGVVQHRV